MALTQVKSDGIATGAVTATQIATGAVTANDLEDSGVTAGTYGSSSAIPAITVDAKGRITSASTNSVSQVGGASGVDFNDSVKARFGTGNDLEIFHDGSHSFIKDVGTGALQLSGGRITMRTGDAASEYMFTADADGAVELYYDNAKKLETTSTGINVTGSVTCDGVTCDGDATVSSGSGKIIIKDNNNTGTGVLSQINGHDSNASLMWQVGNASSSDSNLYVWNNQSSAIRFGTSNTTRAYIDSSGHFYPEVTNSQDLGASSRRWRNIYTNDLNLSNEGGTNDVDGTWGSWTIQEGEDDLFLLNRRNGKKYKFNLTEVS